jgi:hypothetical protein
MRLVDLCMATALFALVSVSSRRWHRTWGADPEEADEGLPGDELIAVGDVQTTRAITISAPPHEVWPWLVQMGQGRAGLYTYKWIENALGAEIKNLDRIDPDLQKLEVGDRIRLTPEVYLGRIPGQSYRVTEVRPQEALVMLQELPTGGLSSWSFMLRPGSSDHTRLIVRSRSSPPPLRRNLGACAGVTDPRTGLLRDGARDAARHQAASRGIAFTSRAPGRLWRVSMTSPSAAVDLYWIPLGAGGHSVRFNGRVFEAIEAARQRRERCDLYHAALIVVLDGHANTIEIAPSPDADEASRGVVATGAVGSRHLGWWRLFRYEVRCWRDGSIPDLGEAVGGPGRLTSDPGVARRLLDLVAAVPTPVWGRDELGAGEMWNSNSVIAWLIATAGLRTDGVGPPARGRAPGWSSGLELARRQTATANYGQLLSNRGMSRHYRARVFQVAPSSRSSRRSSARSRAAR